MQSIQTQRNGASAPAVRDHRGKGWFWADNAIIDLYASQLTPLGVAVYITLARMADNTTQTCFPSYSTIAKLLGISRNSAIKGVQLCIDADLVAISQQWSGKGDQSSNVYHLLPMPAFEDEKSSSSNSAPGSVNSAPPVSNPALGGDAEFTPYQDSSNKKTQEQRGGVSKRIAEAALQAFRELSDSDRNYITGQAELSGRDIEVIMWELKNSEVAYELRRAAKP